MVARTLTFKNHFYIFLGHFLSALSLYIGKFITYMIGFILIEITVFKCLYIMYWSQMMSLDEGFITVLSMEINFIISLLLISIDFKTEEYLVNHFYQASRNLFGLTGPLTDIYPTITFWYLFKLLLR